MNKICGYSCELNKSGVCQISVCDKRLIISDKTEVQTFTRYIDTTITELQQENKQLKDNWNKLKEYINIKLYNVEYLQKLCGCRIDDEIHMILDIIKKEMQELEKGDVND